MTQVSSQDCPEYQRIKRHLYKPDRFELPFVGRLQAPVIANKPPTQGYMTAQSDPPRPGKHGKKQRYGGGIGHVSPYVHDNDSLPVKKASTFREVPTPEGSVHVEEPARFIPSSSQLEHIAHRDTRQQPYPQRFFR